MSFLPNDYKVSKMQGNYMRFEEGENRFRVLGDAITGFEYWVGENQERKPVRVKTFDEVPKEYKTPDAWEENKYPKDFMIFPVFNRKLNKVQILEITQKKIMRGIAALYKSEDWGTPFDYDIIVTKEKTGADPKNVSYSVMPAPKKAIEQKVIDEYNDMNIDLDKLWTGENPFLGENVVLTREQADKIR